MGCGIVTPARRKEAGIFSSQTGRNNTQRCDISVSVSEQAWASSHSQLHHLLQHITEGTFPSPFGTQNHLALDQEQEGHPLIKPGTHWSRQWPPPHAISQKSKSFYVSNHFIASQGCHWAPHRHWDKLGGNIIHSGIINTLFLELCPAL